MSIQHETDGRTGWPKVVGLALGLAVVAGGLVTAFAWPAANTAPRDVPLAVAPAAAVAQIQQQLDQAVPGGFEVEGVDDAAAARAAIEDRDVYGAIVVDPAGPPQVLTATAASPVVAQLVTQLAAAMAPAEGGDAAAGPVIEDVVELPAADPRGAAFAAGALPMVMGGLAVGVAFAVAVPGVGRGVAGALLASVGSGAAVVGVAQSWLGVLEGDWWLNAGVVALTVAAISVTVVGLAALVGRAGIGLAALLMMVVGNPFSGIASAPELLPGGWGAFGQFLPPGAGGSLLRSTSFFDGAAAGQPLVVLGSWLAGGLVLAAAGAALRGRREIGRAHV